MKNSFLSIALLATSLTTHSLNADTAQLTSPDVNQVNPDMTAKTSYGLRIHHDIKHFRSTYHLFIEIWYPENLAKETPNPLEVKKKIVEFIDNYPNKTDWWEEINKNLALYLQKEYPNIVKIHSQLDVIPNNKIPFKRTSFVEYSNEQMIQGFQFKLQYVDGLKNTFKDLDLDVSYVYVEGLGMKGHPDFRLIAGYIDNYLAEHLKNVKDWDQVKPELIQKVLTRFPMIKTIEIKIVTE